MIFRKLYRLTALIFPLIYYISSKNITIIILSIVLILYFIIEILRFRLPALNKFLFEHFSKILKNKEKTKISASTYFLISALFTVLFFEKEIAILAIVIVIIGDAVANIIGNRFGRIKINHRTLEGSLSFFLSSMIVGYWLTFSELNIGILLVFVGAISASIIELLPVKIDDNLVLPLGTSFCMMLVSKFIGFA